MFKIIIMSLSVLFMCGFIIAEESETDLQNAEDVIIFGDDEDILNDVDDISDAEDNEEDDEEKI